MSAQQEMVKVYELAKELGIDSISLLDKLKDLNIRVKNHMSELAEEEAQIARTSLKKPLPAGIREKKPVKARTRKKTEAPSVTPPETEEAPKSKSASPIIRRRTKGDGATTETVSSASVSSAPETEALLSVSAHEELASTEMTEETLASESHESIESATPEVKAESPSAPEPSATSTNEVISSKPVAPRRSVLKIVEATPPPQRPLIKPVPTPVSSVGNRVAPVKGTATQDKDGFRIIKMTKENLNQMVEEEAAKKRGGAGREHEMAPEDVRFADYRKKEMVFLPKKKRIPIGKEIKKTQITQSKAQKRIIEVPGTISVQDLANQLSVKAHEVVRKLVSMGQMVTINHTLDFDTAALVASEYQHEVRNVAFNESALIGSSEDAAETQVPRPPIVTIMGHVDHGKTTLLDSIREANVAQGEAGGITQHIGAYTVQKNGKFITFIDTPGHEAFTVMRARGANVTDIVVLVVSADDGVMPQTREAISHAQAARVPIIVAVNKIDKPGANPEKIKQSLSELNLLAEDWGGQTQFIPVSALKKTNLDQLLEAILLQAEILELKANPAALASGVVLEAKLAKGRGPVASVLVRRGTIKSGDSIVAGAWTGKVRALYDDHAQLVRTASPGYAVEVLGLEGLPQAGEAFHCLDSEADARKISDFRAEEIRKQAAAQKALTAKVSLEDLFTKIQAGQIKELGVILKTDVYGSLEAIQESLLKLSTDQVKVKMIHAAPGGITENDIQLAKASSALIIGFNVRPETKARQLAEAEGIEIKAYKVIYELIDDVRNAMTGLLEKKKVEKFLGRAEVRQVFTIPKSGTIAGSFVVDGKVPRGANLRLLRDSRVIFEGKMSSLRRFKDDVKEVATGYECGIGIENYNDIKPGDLIEAYTVELVAPTSLNG